MSGGLIEKLYGRQQFTPGERTPEDRMMPRGAAACASRAAGLTNCIVTYNGIRVATSIGVQISIAAATNIGFSCSPELAHSPAVTGNITNDPSFASGGERISPGAVSRRA